jgi:hypothetical protein
MRARTTAQMALVGLFHGSRWLTQQSQAKEADRRLEGLSSLGLNEAELREAQLVVAGYIHAAKLDRPTPAERSFDQLRQAAAGVEEEFLNDAVRRIDELILQMAKRHSHWFVRIRYEVMFAVLPLFLLYRTGRNFFYDSFWLGRPLLDTSFYIPAILFLLLWSGLFIMAFTARLRSGLTQRVRELAADLASVRVGGLFPDVECLCEEFARERDRIDAFVTRIEAVRDQYAGPTELGGIKAS